MAIILSCDYLQIFYPFLMDTNYESEWYVARRDKGSNIKGKHNIK
jgi:hypothetical protein